MPSAVVPQGIVTYDYTPFMQWGQGKA